MKYSEIFIGIWYLVHPFMKNKEKNRIKNFETKKKEAASLLSHPYMIYILSIMLLFGLLVGISGLAWKKNWIPSHGLTQGP